MKSRTGLLPTIPASVKFCATLRCDEASLVASSCSEGCCWRSCTVPKRPSAAVIGAVAVTFFTPILPYALAFAAGAMIFVVVEEVIPETQRDKYTDVATLGFIGGFIIMMTLDVGLG